MPNKIIHFIKYNNATVIILAIILILGGGALAAGPEAVGQKQTRTEGLDNTLLVQADLAGFNMDFKIEKIEQDEKYYYVTYNFLDLAIISQAWQYQLNQKTIKISKKIKDDLGVYLTKYLAKHYEARVRELKLAQSQALSQGEQKRMEVTEYGGLAGRTLDLAAKVFPGYEPVKKRELPTPEFIIPPTPFIKGEEAAVASGADSLTRIYNDYVAEHPELLNSLAATSTPASEEAAAATPSSTDTVAPETPAAGNGAGEGDLPVKTPAVPEPTSVEIIELPAEPAPETTPEPAPTGESTPAE